MLVVVELVCGLHFLSLCKKVVGGWVCVCLVLSRQSKSVSVSQELSLKVRLLRLSMLVYMYVSPSKCTKQERQIHNVLCGSLKASYCIVLCSRHVLFFVLSHFKIVAVRSFTTC